MRLFNKKQNHDMPRRRFASDAPKPLASSRLEYSNSFRRNRTITGTTSNNIDSPTTKLQHLESDRQNIHNLSNHRRKVMILFSIAALATILIWLLVSNLTGGVSIGVSDPNISRPIDQKRYQDVIQAYLNVNPASRLNFFLNQDDLTSYVSSRLDEVEKVSNRGMDGLGVTKFVITPRKPLASWQTGSKRSFVDSSGVVFDFNYYTQPSVQIIDNSGIKVSSITSIASKRFLGFVGRAVSLSKRYGYTITEAAIPINTTRQLEVKIQEGNYKIKLSVDRPAGEQIEDMAFAIRYFNGHNLHPQYIDVRVSGRAFYKT